MASGATVSSPSYSSTGLTPNTAYTYAFYSGNSSSSTILTNLSNQPQSATLLTAPYIRTLTVSYNANNYLTLSLRAASAAAVSGTVYLYRYLGSSVPSTLDASGVLDTSGTFTSTTTYYSTGLTANTQYTYAFYNGTSVGTSTQLYSGTSTGVNFPLIASSVVAYTSNQVVSTFTASSIFNTSSVLAYSITNTPASQNATVYLYRFPSTSTPATTLNTTGATNITLASGNINSGGTLTGSVTDSALTASTTYYYAFYNGNTNGTSKLLPITAGGNYITVQTTGVTQSSMTATAISATGATINYNISNAASSSTATLYLYYYTGKIIATTPLNTSTATQITSASPVIPIVLAASGTTGSASVTVTGLTPNTNYTFQFYDGSANGAAPILSTIVNGGTQQFATFKTGVSDTAISNSNVLNTSGTISYTLSNTNSASSTAYLYRFAGSSAPTTLNTSTGTNITSVTTSGGSNTVPTTNTGSYSNTGLSPNTTYVYAFYNGTSNGLSTALTDASGTAAFTSFTTSNLYDSSITTNSLTSTSVTIGYTLTNTSGVAQTAYLYRFTGSSAPSTLDSSGTSIISGGVSVGSAGVTSTQTNSSLTPSTNYTYAFYNGNSIGTSTILTNSSLVAQSLTIFTTTNVIITTLNPSGLTSTQVNIAYNLYNYQNTSKTSYLYRFVGSSAPATLNTSTGTNVITGGVSTSALSGGTPGNSNSNYTNTGLTSNITYTYAFYNGNTNGTSVLLTNYAGTALTTTVYTTSEAIVSSLTSSLLGNTYNTINYSISNGQASSKTLYLYRFSGLTAPSPLDLSGATLLTNFTVASGGSLNSSIADPSLNVNLPYTYAFYNGNSSGSSTILTTYSGTNQVLHR